MAMIEPAECFRCKRTRPHRYGMNICIDCEAERDKREQDAARVCPTCKGIGWFQDDNWECLAKDVKCPACGGTGYALKIPGPLCCPACGGTGEVKDEGVV